jgi:hypothetical protein
MIPRPVGSNIFAACAELESSPIRLAIEPDPTTGLVLIKLVGWPRAHLSLGVDAALEASLALVSAVNALGIRLGRRSERG